MFGFLTLGKEIPVLLKWAGGLMLRGLSTAGTGRHPQDRVGTAVDSCSTQASL